MRNEVRMHAQRDRPLSTLGRGVCLIDPVKNGSDSDNTVVIACSDYQEIGGKISA